MTGFENQWYLIGWIISNFVAVIMLLVAQRSARLARALFFLLFTWACFTNWRTALYAPEDYQEYADLSILTVYKDIITGWFHDHTLLVVGAIAGCQGFIAISMLLKGRILKLGIIGGIIFLLAIIPLGVGSGLPTTIFMAIALFIILYKDAGDYIWKKPSPADEFIEMVD